MCFLCEKNIRVLAMRKKVQSGFVPADLVETRKENPAILVIRDEPKERVGIVRR